MSRSFLFLEFGFATVGKASVPRSKRSGVFREFILSLLRN